MWLLFLKAVCLFWCSSNYLIICTEKTNNQQTNNNGSCCLTAHDVLCLASCVHTLMKQIKNMCGKTKSILLSPAFPTFHSTMQVNFPFPFPSASSLAKHIKNLPLRCVARWCDPHFTNPGVWLLVTAHLHVQAQMYVAELMQTRPWPW